MRIVDQFCPARSCTERLNKNQHGRRLLDNVEKLIAVPISGISLTANVSIYKLVTHVIVASVVFIRTCALVILTIGTL